MILTRPFPWRRLLGVLALACCQLPVALAASPKATRHPARAVAAPPAVTRVQDARTGFAYTIEPAPAWVVPAVQDAVAPTAPAAMHYRIIDDQTRVDAASVAAYSHVVRVVDDPAGLSTASQIEIVFDPSYQTLALHHLEVVRDGRHLDRLDRQRIQLLQREPQLERRMYDGRVTMSIVVDDVRSGDEIDFAYTVRGANPVFGGRFVDTAWLGSQRGPVSLYSLRLLAPAERSIQVRSGPPDATMTTSVADGWRETVFRRTSVPQMEADPGAPYAALLAQQVHFSEFADWADVARWGTALFDRPGAQPLVDQKAAQIRAASADRGAQLLAALDFVQKDIRYFGTEIGSSSHRPAAPDTVITQRFGDCKDKVGLLVALLRRLDMPAVPVLVSTVLRGRVTQLQPTPLAFDHVIARTELDGKPLWLDATRDQQSGTLANRQAIGFGTGLALEAGSTALATLPVSFDTLRVAIVDHIRVQAFAAEPTLESRITYRGDLAELYREALATRSLQELAPELAAPYLRIYPKIRSTAPLRVEQSTDDDAISFVQAFSVPDFWRFPQQRALVADFVQWGAAQALAAPKSQTRRDALGFSFPGLYRHEITIDFPEDVFRSGGSRHFEDGASQVSVRSTLEGTPRSIDAAVEVRVGTDQVDAADWPAYTAALNRILPRLAGNAAVSPIPLDKLPALQAEMQTLKDALARKRVTATTPVQSEALFKTLVLSAQIAGGRLPPALEAQALNARGIEYDNLGQAAKAAPDFERALQLAPDANDIRNAAAVNANERRDFGRAVALADEVLARVPGDTEALNVRALAHYFQKDLGAAEADFGSLLKDRDAVHRGYPIVWLSLALRQEGRDPAPLAATYPSAQLPTEWPRPLVDMALGTRTVDAVVQAAKAQKQPAESLCEAYFYIGETYHAHGDETRAREYWRKSVDQGVVEFVEDAAARFRLGEGAPG